MCSKSCYKIYNAILIIIKIKINIILDKIGSVYKKYSESNIYAVRISYLLILQILLILGHINLMSKT